MPTLRFTVEEAPSLLRALQSHDAVLFDRALEALREYPKLAVTTHTRPDAKVHLLRAER